MKKPTLYSTPEIFHVSIGHEDTPDYIRVCAHNNDPMPLVLTYMQNSNYEMLYGPFKEIKFDSECNCQGQRTHYKLLLPKPQPQPRQDTQTNPTP